MVDTLFFVKTDRKIEKAYRKMPEFYRRRIFELGRVLKVKPVPAQEYDVIKLGGTEDSYRIRIRRHSGFIHGQMGSPGNRDLEN